MSFSWTRSADFITSRCTLCGHTTRERDERAILDQQRTHDAFTCQLRRAENARVAATEAFLADLAIRATPKPERTHCPKGIHGWTPENAYTSPQGYDQCRVCNREQQAAKSKTREVSQSRVSQAMATGLGVALGTIEASGAAPDLTPKPLLNTPIERSILMQNNSASATPRQNSRGVA